MNWWALLLVVLLAPVVICGLWLAAVLIVDEFRSPVPLGLCECGEYTVSADSYLRSGGRVHSRSLCQPYHDWLDI